MASNGFVGTSSVEKLGFAIDANRQVPPFRPPNATTQAKLVGIKKTPKAAQFLDMQAEDVDGSNAESEDDVPTKEDTAFVAGEDEDPYAEPNTDLMNAIQQNTGVGGSVSDDPKTYGGDNDNSVPSSPIGQVKTAKRVPGLRMSQNGQPPRPKQKKSSSVMAAVQKEFNRDLEQLNASWSARETAQREAFGRMAGKKSRRIAESSDSEDEAPLHGKPRKKAEKESRDPIVVVSDSDAEEDEMDPEEEEQEGDTTDEEDAMDEEEEDMDTRIAQVDDPASDWTWPMVVHAPGKYLKSTRDVVPRPYLDEEWAKKCIWKMAPIQPLAAGKKLTDALIGETKGASFDYNGTSYTAMYIPPVDDMARVKLDSKSPALATYTMDQDILYNARRSSFVWLEKASETSPDDPARIVCFLPVVRVNDAGQNADIALLQPWPLSNTKAGKAGVGKCWKGLAMLCYFKWVIMNAPRQIKMSKLPKTVAWKTINTQNNSAPLSDDPDVVVPIIPLEALPSTKDPTHGAFKPKGTKRKPSASDSSKSAKKHKGFTFSGHTGKSKPSPVKPVAKPKEHTLFNASAKPTKPTKPHASPVKPRPKPASRSGSPKPFKIPKPVKPEPQPGTVLPVEIEIVDSVVAKHFEAIKNDPVKMGAFEHIVYCARQHWHSLRWPKVDVHLRSATAARHHFQMMANAMKDDGMNELRVLFAAMAVMGESCDHLDKWMSKFTDSPSASH